MNVVRPCISRSSPSIIAASVVTSTELVGSSTRRGHHARSLRSVADSGQQQPKPTTLDTGSAPVAPVDAQPRFNDTDRVILEVLGQFDGGLSSTQWQAACKGIAGRSLFREARDRLEAAELIHNEGTHQRTRYVLTEKGLDWLTTPIPET